MARVDVVGTIASDDSSSSLLASSAGSLKRTMDYVDRLIADENNIGMLLYIDSPGGEMKAGDDLYLKLMDYKATGRPIYCYFDSLACSGGYYVAMASDEICANRNCMCVNIGVYISTYNMTGLFEKLGGEQVNFKSSENKGIGMSGVPWTEEQVRTLDDGREMLASQALEAGFIDSIGRYEDYEKQVLQAMGTDVLYEYTEESDPFTELFKYFSSFIRKSESETLLDFAEAHSRAVVMAYGG